MSEKPRAGANLRAEVLAVDLDGCTVRLYFARTTETCDMKQWGRLIGETVNVSLSPWAEQESPEP